MERLLDLNYHLIAIDNRGYGRSSYNNRCSFYADWAKDLIELCELKNIKKCICIGLSMGGTISMKMAELAPSLVQKVVLTCSASH